MKTTKDRLQSEWQTLEKVYSKSLSAQGLKWTIDISTKRINRMKINLDLSSEFPRWPPIIRLTYQDSNYIKYNHEVIIQRWNEMIGLDTLVAYLRIILDNEPNPKIVTAIDASRLKQSQKYQTPQALATVEEPKISKQSSSTMSKGSKLQDQQQYYSKNLKLQNTNSNQNSNLQGKALQTTINARLKKEFTALQNDYPSNFYGQNLKHTIEVANRFQTRVKINLQIKYEFPRWPPIIKLAYQDSYYRNCSHQVSVEGWLPGTSLISLVKYLQGFLETERYPSSLTSLDLNVLSSAQSNSSQPVKIQEQQFIRQSSGMANKMQRKWDEPAGISLTQSSQGQYFDNNRITTPAKQLKEKTNSNIYESNSNQPVRPSEQHYNTNNSLRQATLNINSDKLTLSIDNQLQGSYKVIIQNQQGTGIRNFGNTCFLNSAVQALFCRKLIRYLVIGQNNTKSQRWNALSQIFMELESTTEPYSNSRTINALEQNFRNSSYAQKDSYEFLVNLIGSLVQEKEDIARLFALEFSENVQCNCRTHRQTKRDEFILEVFANEKYKSVQDFLDKGSEMIGDSCPYCRQTKVTKNIYQSEPAYVFAHINWTGGDQNRGHTQTYNGYGNSYSSSTTSAKQLFNYFNDINLGGKNYSLQGLICHSGTQYGGHYVYYNMQDKGWVCFNDAIVYSQSRPDGKRPILAVYERKHTATQTALFFVKQSEIPIMKSRFTEVQKRKSKKQISYPKTGVPNKQYRLNLKKGGIILLTLLALVLAIILKFHREEAFHFRPRREAMAEATVGDRKKKIK